MVARSKFTQSLVILVSHRVGITFLIDVSDVDDRFCRDEVEILEEGFFVERQFYIACHLLVFKTVNQLMKGRDFRQSTFLFGGESLSFDFFKSLFQDIDIGKNEFQIDFHGIGDWIDRSSVIGDDVGILKAAYDVDDGIGVSDVA